MPMYPPCTCGDYTKSCQRVGHANRPAVRPPMTGLRCNHCLSDNVLVLDPVHASRRLGFDRYVCPSCRTSFPEGSPIIQAQSVSA